jgi:hypothetical protein
MTVVLMYEFQHSFGYAFFLKTSIILSRAVQLEPEGIMDGVRVGKNVPTLTSI